MHTPQNMQEYGFSLTNIAAFHTQGTWELINLFAKTKYFNYHICYENIGKWSRAKWQADHGQTELNNILVKKNVLNEIN